MLYAHKDMFHFDALLIFLLGPAAAAGVGFAGRLVEGLGLHGEALALGHQVVQLLPSLQDGGYGVVEDDLGLVQLVLHLGQGIGRLRRLVLVEVHLEGPGEALDLRPCRPLGAGHLSSEVVQDLGDEPVGHPVWLLVVGDGQAVAPHKDVAHVLGLLD